MRNVTQGARARSHLLNKDSGTFVEVTWGCKNVGDIPARVAMNVVDQTGAGKGSGGEKVIPPQAVANFYIKAFIPLVVLPTVLTWRVQLLDLTREKEGTIPVIASHPFTINASP